MPRIIILFVVNLAIAFLVARAIDPSGLFFWGGFSAGPIHQFVGRALAEGLLHIPISLAHGLQFDLQFYNGMIFTNWGFGTPFLHAIAGTIYGWMDGSMTYRYFPDGTILWLSIAAVGCIFSDLFYEPPVSQSKLTSRWRETTFRPATCPEAQRGISRYWALSGRSFITLFLRIRRWRFSRQRLTSRTNRYFLPILAYWSITAATVLAIATSRFLQYEFVIAAMQIALMIPLILTAKAMDSTLSRREVVLLATFTGFAILIRPTALVIMGPFLAFLCFAKAKEYSRQDRALFTFTMASLALVFFATNYFKTGSIISFGFENSISGITHETAKHRFGSDCQGDLFSILNVAWEILKALFVGTRDRTFFTPDCYFMIEKNSTNTSAFLNPYLLAASIGSMAILAFKKPAYHKAKILMPIVVFSLVFAAYVWAGSAIIYRYAGDFYPPMLIPIFAALRIDYEHVQMRRYLSIALLLATALCVPPLKKQFSQSTRLLSTLEQLKSYGGGFVWYSRLQKNWGGERNAQLPESITCENRPEISGLAGQFRGWNQNCRTWSFTNVFIGLPKSPSKNYRLDFTTENGKTELIDDDALTKNVVINGKTYLAERTEFGYRTEFGVDRRKFREKIIQATIEWRRSPRKPGPKLEKIEISSVED